MFQFLTPYHGGTITFRTNKKGRITGVGKIGIHSYPSIDNFLFVEGLKHNVLSKSQLGIMDMLFPLTRMSVSSSARMGPPYSLPREKVTSIRLGWESY